jgi:hypothetical protein
MKKLVYQRCDSGQVGQGGEGHSRLSAAFSVWVNTTWRSRSKIKWVNEPVRSTTASKSTAPADKPATNVDSNARTASDGTAKTTTGAATTTRSAKENWYPDHAVYNTTKDQLKAMPQFKY